MAMARYVYSFVLAVLAVGAFFFVHWMNGTNTSTHTHTTLGVIDWSAIGAFALFGILSAWGMIGVALSNLKKRANELALEDVVISRKSWHYRLNTWLNFKKEPRKGISECEYWAQLANGFYSQPPVYVCLGFLTILVGVIGWFFSARPDFSNIRHGKLDFYSGNQFVGPIVLALMLIAGLYAGLTFSGAGEALTHAPWLTIGKWSGAGIAGLIGLLVASIIFWNIVTVVRYTVVQPLVSLAIARIVRVCRKTKFVD